MKSKVNDEKTDEYQPLLNSKNNSPEQSVPRQRQPSRLEWAESSWIRLWYIISWQWINPLLSLGYKTTLSEEDLDDLPNQEKCSVLYDMIKNSQTEHEKTFIIFRRVFWKRYLLVTSLRLPIMIFVIAQPLFLYKLVLYITDHQHNQLSPSAPVYSGYLYAAGLFSCALFQALFYHQYYFYSARLDLMIRNSLLSTIFAHLLSINTTTLRQVGTNYVTSIVTNDVTKFEEFSKHTAYIIEAPFISAVIFGLLYWINGFWSTVSGYLIFILLIPLQVTLGQKFNQHRKNVVVHTDRRIHACEELIRGIHVIKMYNWEEYMKKRVCETREPEINSIRHAFVLRAINMGLFLASIPLTGFATYFGAWLSGRHLTTIQLFITLAFFSQMRFPVMYSLPVAIEKLVVIRQSWKRIIKFLQLTSEHEQKLLDPKDSQQKGTITMHDASFSWDERNCCLSLLNIRIEPGTFVGIVGPVGSGKSSLFSAILGEMILVDGQINVNNSSFSYAAQSPWIFADTLRANIIFGKSFDEQRYRSVLHACCLDIDLTILGSNADLTMIGENGVNLSGGQKARVCLARALYADSDIYLLDDPLAAVDRVVAKRIYDKCIGPKGLLKNKTRLLITHQTQYLTKCQQIIVCDQGKMQIKTPNYNLNQQDNEDEEEKQISAAMLDIGQLSASHQSIIVKETSKTLHIRSSLWYSLFTAPPLKALGLCLTLILLLCGQILHDGTNLWLAFTSRQLKYAKSTNSIPLSTYFILTIATLFVAIVRSNFFFYQILNGSNYLHNKMLSGLLHASMRFFESNPSGRILNRMSKDQQIVDETLPEILFDAIQSLLLPIGFICIILIINLWMIPITIFVVIIFWFYFRYYIRSSQQLKRMESMTRSPIYGLFASSLKGLTTIRAFKVENDLINAIETFIDDNTRLHLHLSGTTRWFTCRMDLLATLFVFFPAFAAVIAPTRVDAIFLTLTLFYSINITARLQHAIRQSADAYNHMTSAERIDEYGDLPPEEDNGGSKRLIKTSADWPSQGEIRFHNYSLRYQSNQEATLKNLNLVINSAEKVGIIGRTGAGKSSVFQGLLRLVDRSCIDGEILIDDIDISRITLNHLRSQISVIPQNPILFSGTLRFNLDPLNFYSDEQCWKVLEIVQLKEMVFNHPQGLHMSIAESGHNLSIGQCQLICVSRALLRESRILLIDEATANVDHETDQLLQSLIVDVVKDRTVLTIAHRLNTVTNNDRLLLLDGGKIVDFDVPETVLNHV
ncbi:hypothetical protein I4U23_022431 [Adineta vaga]|nr:hypothetical protein I4U23_022431 [Adineta vaga]